jgi:hypothetical protein
MPRGKPEQPVPQDSTNRPASRETVSEQVECERGAGAVSGGLGGCDDWLNKAHRLERKAFEDDDQETLKFVHKFLSGLLQVKQLLNLFRQAQGRLEGVADLLGISRNAVYLRLDLVGLKADDFRERGVDVRHLVGRSKKLDALVKELQEKMA